MVSHLLRRFPMAALALMAGLAVHPTVRAQDLPALEPMLRDVERMEVGSNPERREVLMEMLSERGIEFELEAFDIEPRVNYPRRVGANIVVTLGDGPADIVIGAHFDAVWLMGGTLGRGAVDNAASSIVLTRLASTLGAETLRHRIRIVFFDMEEIGLLGSRNYVSRHGSEEIAAAINLDVNGYGDTLIFGPTAAEGNTALPESMREVCTEHDFNCMEYPRFANSDHLSFQAAGIPNVSLSVLPQSEAEELRTFFNGTEAEIQALDGLPAVLGLIHTAGDKSDRVDPAGMAIAYRAVHALVHKLDSSVE